MLRHHRIAIVLALLVEVLRLAGRTIYVFVTGTPEGIPLIFLALVSIACLMYLLVKGGGCPVVLYTLFEPFLSTTIWIVILYAIDTNDFCRDMGDSVCDIPDEKVTEDYITRPYPSWLFLLIPGLIFDVIFICVFRSCPGV